MDISTQDLIRLVEEKKKMTRKEYLASSLSDFAVESSLFSGQERSTMWENWYASNLNAQKVNNVQDRGDLKIGDIYIELKTRFLPSKEIKRGIVHTAGQVRLWQEVDYYLFVTIDQSDFSVSQFLIGKSDLHNLLKEGKVSHGNSHVAGVCKETLLDLTKKVELGVVLDSKKYDWSKHKVTIDEIKQITSQGAGSVLHEEGGSLSVC